MPANLIRRPPILLHLDSRRPNSPAPGGTSRVAQGSEQDRVLAPRLVVLQHVGQCRSDDAAPVAADAVLRAQAEPGPLQGHEILARAVEGDLLVVLGSLRRRPARRAHSERSAPPPPVLRRSGWSCE